MAAIEVAMAAGSNWRQSEFAGGICPFLLSVTVRPKRALGKWVNSPLAGRHDGRSHAAALPFRNLGISSIISPPLRDKKTAVRRTAVVEGT